MISTRTRDALRAYRDGRHVSKRIRALYPDGVPPEIVEATAGRLGAHLPQCRNLDAAAIAKGRIAGIEARQARALKPSLAIGRLIETMRASEPAMSLEEIARRLNGKRRNTPRGELWTGRQVKRVLDRLKSKPV
jgi:hypothetical protein